MTNRYELCCHDYDLVRKTSRCDGIYCSGNHNPQFSVYFHKINKRSCYCLNREQLGQYSRCIAKDREWLFSELRDAHFLLQM